MRNKSLHDTGDALGDGGPVLVPARGNQLQNLRHTEMQFNSHTVDYSIHRLLLAAPAASVDRGCRREPDEQEPPGSFHQTRTPRL